jgi:surface polysaccharide O-acyltransferase-like enzyme
MSEQSAILPETGSASKENMLCRRIGFLDSAKVLAIYLVCLYHTANYAHVELRNPVSIGTYAKYFIGGLATIGVPLFLMVNGYLLLNRPFDLERHLKRTLRLFLLTILWSLITILVVTTIQGDRYSIPQIVRTIFSLKLGVNNHLWFLFTLVSIYLLFPFLRLSFDYHDKRIIWWAFALPFFFSFGITFVNWGLNTFAFLRRHGAALPGGLYSYIFFNWLNINPFYGKVYALVYFVAGGIMGRNSARKGRWVSLPVSTVIAVFFLAALALFGYGIAATSLNGFKTFDTVYFGYDSMSGLLMTLSAFLFLRRIWRRSGIDKFNALISSIGANTLGIYLLHIPLNSLFSHYLQLGFINSIPGALIYALFLLLFSWLLTLLLKRIPGIRLLFSL